MNKPYDLQRLKKRQAGEWRFRFYGRATIALVLILLGLMLVGISWKSFSAFHKTFIRVDVTFLEDQIKYDPSRPIESLRQVNFRDLVSTAFVNTYHPQELSHRDIHQLISPGAELSLFKELKIQPEKIGGSYSVWLLASDNVDYFFKHKKLRTVAASSRRLSDVQIAFLDDLRAHNNLKRQFNWMFFTNGDSRSPELAGIFSALVGSFFTILVTLLLAFPLGISAAIYLEEFAPRNKLVRFFELNINNLASVPSIVFGLLGLAVFLNVMHLPRSSTLVGGMTLALMIMPTIVIASRSAMQMVPKSIHQAAEGLGASPVQVVFHHVVPLAMPGILTGTILGVARALGESAALLMIGMVAFIVDAPQTLNDPATVLPVQIFNWARNPEQGFTDHTAAAIMVLLLFLIVMNFGAILLRKRYEYRW